MLYFDCDYNNGAHPEVLRRLIETNGERLPGYGADRYTESAGEKLRAACACPQAQITLLTGGTQTNAIVIASLLRDWEGVVAADTGHVSVHEAGAIEYTGHKVLSVPQKDGKLSAAALEKYLSAFEQDANREHMVFPGLVYITHPTEYGTLYTKAELEALARVCRGHHLPLYLDGARLAYALASHETDVTLPDIARLCDVFYIGGTKAGALCGEAVVFTRNNCPPHFMNAVKKRLGLMAKGRVLGVQFDALFTDDLYLRIGRHVIAMAERMKEILHEKGLTFALESPTNQQFILMADSELARIRDRVCVDLWEKADETHTVVRFCTSWATTEEELEALRAIL